MSKRSEEHTSELQSRGHLVCRLLLEKKKLADEGGRDVLAGLFDRPRAVAVGNDALVTAPEAHPVGALLDLPVVFFFNDTATTEIYTLSLHDALPIRKTPLLMRLRTVPTSSRAFAATSARSEEHTSELQSRGHLVCRLLLEKKKKHELRTSALRPKQHPQT